MVAFIHMIIDIKKDLHSFASPTKAKKSARFFKTASGQYGHGDLFIGVTVPEVRSVAKKFFDLPLTDIQKLLQSKIHEERLLALILLVNRFKKASEKERKTIYEFYIKNTKYINNWDLVDTSAGYIVGGFLHDKPKTILKKLARSTNLWERRIAIIATFYDIYQGKSEETFKIATILINDEHDLIHKAVGWMLREVGKRCGESIEESFLEKYYRSMPRTMLRYAIERFPKNKRKQYLDGTIFS
jgi:3-methyladenine DNA glycosylase AlkD